MSEEMKGLLKYDTGKTARGFLMIVPCVIGLLLWFWLLLGEFVNPFLLLLLYANMMILNWSMADWQREIGSYISMGMTRKNIFRVMLVRALELFVVSIALELLLGSLYYPQTGFGKLVLVSAFLLIFCWGFGQFSGVLVYQRKKLGTVLQILGFMVVGGMLGFGCVLGMESSEQKLLTLVLEIMSVPLLCTIGIVAVIVGILGFCVAGKQIKSYQVC